MLTQIGSAPLTVLQVVSPWRLRLVPHSLLTVTRNNLLEWIRPGGVNGTLRLTQYEQQSRISLIFSQKKKEEERMSEDLEQELASSGCTEMASSGNGTHPSQGSSVVLLRNVPRSERVMWIYT